MNEEDGGVYGGHRQTDPAASGGAAQQPDPGGQTPEATVTQFQPAGASIAQHLAYLAQQASLQAQYNARYAQQGTGVGLAQMQGLGLQGMSLAQAFTAGHAIFGSHGQGWVDPIPLPPLEDAGISAGEIIGHRVWCCLDGGWLGSVAVDVIWPPDEPMTLGAAPQLPQGLENGGGVHAFKTRAEAIRNYKHRKEPQAYGTIALWGEVIEHERGYRAEFGKILSVDHVAGVYRWKELKLLRQIRQRYGLETK